MTAMLQLGKPVFVALAALLALPIQAQEPGKDAPKDKPAPAIRALVTRITPEATLAMAGTRGLTTGDGSLWVSLKESSTLQRVDPKSNKTTQTVTLPAPACSGMSSGFGSIWVPLCNGKGIARVDVKTHTIVATLTKGITAVTLPIVSAADSLWAITDDQGTVARIDPTTNAVVAEVYTGAGASGMVAAQEGAGGGNAG